MKKKSNKNAKSTSEYDSKRQQNVLLEKMYSEIKAIGEGHSSMSERIEEMDKTLRKLDSHSFRIEMDVEAVKSKTGTIDIKMDRIEKELGTIKAAVLENSRDTKEIKISQDEIKHLTSYHEERIKKLELVK